MIKECIEQERDTWRKVMEMSGNNRKVVIGGDYWKLLDYVVANGQEFKGRKLPSRYAQRMMKRCYWNSWSLVRSSKTLRYVEGKCIGYPVPFPFDHAWAIDRNGLVVDTTLQDVLGDGKPNGDLYEYYGVIFERDELPKRYNEHESPLQARVTKFLKAQQQLTTAP